MTTWVVGIAGGSGSGKSWLARHLADHLGPDVARVLSADRYYRPLPPEAAARPELQDFDVPEALDTALLDTHLAALRAGEAVHVPDYDFATHQRTGHAPFAPVPVLVVEGHLLLCRPEVRAHLDLAVFVEAPAPIRLARRLVRDVEERGRDEAEVRTRFARHVEPRHQQWVEPTRAHAHLAVDGTAPVSQHVEALVARLPLRLRHP